MIEAEDDPLLSLAELLYVTEVGYIHNETPPRREVRNGRWPILSALKSAQEKGWRFNYVGE